jgi:membrane protein required for colicin V production
MFYDMVVVAVLLFATYRGARKGIVWQLAVIASIVFCFGFAGSLSLAMAPFFAVEPPLDRWLAMLVLYVVFSFGAFAVARQLRTWIEKAKFEEYDRHLGAVFGLVKGVLICLVLSFFAVTLGEKLPGVRDQVFYSFSGRTAAVLMDRLHPVLPEELHEVLEPYIHSLDRPGLDLHAHDYDGEDPRHHDDHDHGPFREPTPVPGTNRPVDDERLPPAPLTPEPTGDPFARPDRFDAPRSGAEAPSTVRPVGGVQSDAAAQRERRQMLDEIGSVYSDDRTAQSGVVAEVEQSLSGLPERVKLAVVKDWYTDLLVFDRGADPDPGTDLSTPLDQRIVRELDRSGVPLSTLSSTLRDRLRTVRR